MIRVCRWQIKLVSMPWAAALGFGCTPLCALAQAPIVLRQADLLRTEQGPAGIVRYLDGNVWITQDTLSITADHAIYDEVAGQILFNGNVHFTEPTRQLWAERAIYFERDGRADAEGNVRIEQDSVTMSCDRAVYHEAREEVNLVGNVRIHSLSDNAVLTGDLGNYNRREERGAMTKDPRLVRYFAESDSMSVSGKVIEYQFGEKAATVKDSVHLQRGDFDAWGQRLFYHDEGEWARLTGEPLLKRRQDIMQADTVDAYFEQERIKRIVLTSRARAFSPVDSLVPEPQNKASGRNMVLTFRSGELDSIHIQGNATSVYYVREEGQKKGANRVSGDVIDMWISQNQVKWIYVEGGTEGVYYPPQLEHLVVDERAQNRTQDHKFPAGK